MTMAEHDTFATHDEAVSSTPRPDVEETGEVAELKARVADLEDRWRRAAADLDNLRKRFARESKQQLWQERSRVAGAWLPVVDNLELALQHADADPASIVQGVRAVHEQALTVLSGLGFARRDDLCAKFDPALHEAVSTTPSTGSAPGTVVAVVRPGYGEGERQLRPAAVVVATEPAGDTAADDEHER